ncbi:hypothetical protein QJS66_16495 [Kocuria rhizophila]|nr:hypothetical protein QJS66_16495 [Kocuria rhizophila]
MDEAPRPLQLFTTGKPRPRASRAARSWMRGEHDTIVFSLDRTSAQVESPSSPQTGAQRRSARAPRRPSARGGARGRRQGHQG